MDSTETIRNLQEDIAEIVKLVNWMEKSREIHQIDIDVLLIKTRYLYNLLISLPVGQPEPPQQPATSNPQPATTNLQPATTNPQPATSNPQPGPARETISEMNLFQRDGSLNEALGKQKPVHDVASSITDIPVADIWSAITINERFLFIRELFGNDPEGFKNTVTLLNSLGSWEAAKKFMTDRFEWDNNNPVATDFLNVVRRRFLR